jgi:ATP-dependent RNA helicase RhlE
MYTKSSAKSVFNSKKRPGGGRSTYHARGNRRPRGGGGQFIHPSRFIKEVASTSDQPVYQATHQFGDFSLNTLLKTNLQTRGYITPTPIQDQAIPAGLSGSDVVGIANTGTGKTAAFALPILHKLMQEPQYRAIIIAPTRELAQQIYDEFRQFARGSRLFGSLIIGGTSMPAQIRDLKQRPRVIIGTPGRLKDHIERGTLDLSSSKYVVLDEVDRMVDMGFIDDIRYLLGRLPDSRQSYFFSATLDPKLESLVNSFLHDPVTISVKTGETSDNVAQDVIHFSANSDKMQKLHLALTQTEGQKTLIFDQTQRGVERLSRDLLARGFKADAIHGGKNQNQRSRALQKFKQNNINVLVATDVAARGIDVADITHVINYSVPKTYDDYIHRIGRAGRAGRVGQALTFVGA